MPTQNLSIIINFSPVIKLVWFGFDEHVHLVGCHWNFGKNPPDVYLYVIKTQLLFFLISNHFKKLLWAPSIICCWIDPNNTMYCLIRYTVPFVHHISGYYYSSNKCTLHEHRTVPYYCSLCSVFCWSVIELLFHLHLLLIRIRPVILH